MVAYYFAVNYRDSSREARVEVLKFILHQLWVKQRIPYFLFAGDPHHVMLSTSSLNQFAWPIRSLLLW